MNYSVDVVVADYVAHIVKVGDVGLDEAIVGSLFDVAQIGQISGISEFVEVDYVIFRIFSDKQAHHMAADEPGTAGDEDVSLVIIHVIV